MSELLKQKPAPVSDALVEVKKGLCGICPAGCWVSVTLEEGRLKQVKALEDHPLGMICTNGSHSAEIVNDPNRLRHPLKRVGAKGGYQFERISWDEAYQIIVERLESIKAESGPEATAIYTGRGGFELSLCDIFQPADTAVSSASSVLFPFGSPNTLGVGALCYVSFAMIAPHVTMGEMYISMETDIEQSQLIVVWGANPATDSPPLAHQQIKRAKAKGAEVVVIDPRRSETARETGAEWVPLRPGSDGALALGLLQVLIEEELYDEDFVNNWTVGWDELQQYTQHFRPEIVEGITGVPAETIRDLARRIATARGASIVMYSGLEYSENGVQAIRAVFTLWAVAGQLDVPGGLLFSMKENKFPINRSGLVPNPAPRKALGRDRFPVYSQYRGESHAIALPDSVLKGDPYKIRSLIILGGSIITGWPNPDLWRKTLGELDFLVCIDRHFTADAAYADLVLPATTMYETESYMTYGPMFKIREKMIDPVGEARDDFIILAELARRLGYGEKYPQDSEERLRYILEGSGFTLEEVRKAGGSVQITPVMMQYKKWEKGLLRPDGKPGFNTPTGKFEIASTILTEHGYEALPVYREPQEGPLAQPDLSRRYPLVFSSGARIFADFRSQHHGVPGLNKMAPEPVVTINEKDAAARKIVNGGWVWVETPRGKIKYRARVTADIMAGVVEANMGGGGPLGPKAWQECNVNELTDITQYDPISGFPVYKALLCEVTPEVKSEVKSEVKTKSASEGAGGEPAEIPSAEFPSDREEDPAHVRLNHSGQEQSAEHQIREVYLDHNASTPVHKGVLEAMLPYLKNEGGNPSSIHKKGNSSHQAVETARRQVAQALNCTARRIIFTGGGSEADNLAIKGVALAQREKGNHIITTAIEHPAVLNTCQALGGQGFEITVLETDGSGLVDLQQYEQAFRPETILATVMMANNEIGTIQPITEMAAIAHRHGVLFHTDAIQALGKVPLDLQELGVDLLSISAHKAHGPKGMGALYVKAGVEITPLIDGGGHERGLRSGTENVPGIVGFGKACGLAVQWLNQGKWDQVKNLRDKLEEGIRKLAPDAKLNGHKTQRLPNTLNLTLPNFRGESLVLLLDKYGVYFSSGSACKSGNPDPSHVLKAIGLSDEDAHCAVRLSLGVDNDEASIDYALNALGEVLRKSQDTVRFVACR